MGVDNGLFESPIQQNLKQHTVGVLSPYALEWIYMTYQLVS